MTDFNKLADALRSENAGVRACAAMEVESLLRDAAGVDVAGLMAMSDTSIVLACDYLMTHKESAKEKAVEHRAALESSLRLVLAQRVPPGCVVVPVEPTEAMLEAAHNSDREYTLRNFGDIMTVMQGPYDHWCSMIAAAPQAKEQTA